MSLDPRTPVILGVGAIMQHSDEPSALSEAAGVSEASEASEALDLMAASSVRAARDAGAPGLLSAVDSIWMPRGFWAYSSPGHLLAERFGASSVRHSVAEIGVLQTSILGHAARALARGESEVAIIVGGESRDRDVRLRRQGLEAATTIQTDQSPDEILRPSAEIMSPFEIELGLVTPATQYAFIDNALRYREGKSLAEHRTEIGRLWGGFNRVAVENPDAWDRTPMQPDEIAIPTDSNRMLSFPYTKSLVSQWNVNQAGALILSTLENARRLGLDEDRLIFPLAVVDSEAMLTLSERRDLHRSVGFRHAGARALSHVDRRIDEIAHLELYSCFPAAVRVQQRELGVDPARPVTETGGMTFGGGPLNNFVIQGWIKMVERLREDLGSMGMVTAVSGILTKQGVSLLGPEPDRPFLFDQVTEAARRDQATIRVDPDACGRARVASYTVIHDREGTTRIALVLDFDDERRSLRVLEDARLAEEAMENELCGRRVLLEAGGAIRWS